jgi:acetylornithine deacetylase/succinyl-diaminopimelate desuccinylase-like protein
MQKMKSENIITSGWLRTWKLLPLVAILMGQTFIGEAQTLHEKTRQYRETHEREILDEFIKLLGVPNVASDKVNISRNAALIVEMMRRRGLKPRLIDANNGAAPPAIYGEWMTPTATRTLVFYAHYDGQPTDPNHWTGSRPWEPVVRSAPIEKGGQIISIPLKGHINPEWRLYARSASDDKAGVMAILAAFDALRSMNVTLTSNIKIFFDGEEEAGSPNLKEVLIRHRDLLAADAWLICDGPIHQSGLKQVVFGVRGDTNVNITVYGAKRPLHSGHYGNWSPNPAMQLAQLLASMKNSAGRVTIDGWYDDVEPLGEAEVHAITEAPDYDEQLKSELGIARPEGGGKGLMHLINEPSLNINGLSGGDVGPLARNIIPTTASVVLDLRLVRGNDYQRQFNRLVEHIVKQGFFVTDQDPTEYERSKHPLLAKVNQRKGGYNAARTPMNLPISLRVVEAVQWTTTNKVVRLPTFGGSLPLSIITENLGTVTITVPIANYDNNQHAENENIRLQNLWDGIETYAALMTMTK